MRSLAQIFLKSFVIRLSALTLAGSIILIFARILEGRTLDFQAILVEMLPFAALGGAAWSITEWKRQGGVIAIAAGGRSPWPIAALFAFFTSPLVLVPYAMVTPSSPPLDASRNALHVTFDTTTHFHWHGGRIERQFQGVVEQGPVFPAPEKTLSTDTHVVWWTAGAQLSIALALVYWLVFTRTQAVGAVLSVTGIGAGLSVLLLRLGQFP